ncbi:hypothetical protein LSH36_427g02031 [Paralvinella palmiformis]|uniref:Uncharacterized protein n=1 Tax=Paralvinella palmiformis TaxID=53620 RepID=A0AAD9JCX6_9ANNE|nr:hypothetical protein LSH36_427g02031 [Paralvinella palmiformis]
MKSSLFFNCNFLGVCGPLHDEERIDVDVTGILGGVMGDNDTGISGIIMELVYKLNGNKSLYIHAASDGRRKAAIIAQKITCTLPGTFGIAPISMIDRRSSGQPPETTYIDEANKNAWDKVLNILVHFYDQKKGYVVQEHLAAQKSNLATVANIFRGLDAVMAEKKDTFNIMDGATMTTEHYEGLCKVKFALKRRREMSVRMKPSRGMRGRCQTAFMSYQQHLKGKNAARKIHVITDTPQLSSLALVT